MVNAFYEVHTYKCLIVLPLTAVYLDYLDDYLADYVLKIKMCVIIYDDYYYYYYYSGGLKCRSCGW